MRQNRSSAAAGGAEPQAVRGAACPPGAQSGFTVTELIIVLVIIGFVVTIAAPKIDIVKFRLESDMQGVGLTLLAAERQAITQQHDVVLLFDVPQGVIRIHDDKNNNSVVDAGERVRGVALGEGVVFGLAGTPARPMGPGPVVFTKMISGFPALVFHRDGSASEAGGFYLTSTRAVTSGAHLTDTRAIEMERATGRASWYRYGAAGTWQRAF